MQSISCNRTWALFEGLRHHFDEVLVVTTSNRHMLPQDPTEIPEGVVFDAKTVDYRTLFQKKGKTSVAGEKMKLSAAGRLAAKLQSSFPTLRLFGEGGLIYYWNAVRIGSKLVRDRKITHVLSSFPPYADHLIGLKLKRRFPGLFWIADFRDLHVDPAQENLFLQDYQVYRNRQLLAKADLITTVSEGLAVHLSKLHPSVQVLRNGIRTFRKSKVSDNDKFTLAYTGSMFQDKRRPETLLKALRLLIDDGTVNEQRINLIYAGKDSAVWFPMIRKYGLEAVFIDRGLLSKSDADQVQQSSHLNILLTYSTHDLKGNLTGKLYDYLSAGRPILVIVNGPVDDELESVIAEVEAGDVIYHDDVKRASEIIGRAYRLWEEDRTSVSMNLSALRKMSWDNILDEFVQANGWKRPVVAEDNVTSSGQSDQ